MALLSGTGNTKGLIVNTFLAFTEALNLRVSQLLCSIFQYRCMETYVLLENSVLILKGKRVRSHVYIFFALTLFSSRNAEEETRKNCNIRVLVHDPKGNLIRKHFWHNKHN